MEMAGTCLHTNNVPRLAGFYAGVLGVKADGNDVHAALEEARLAIWNPGDIDNDKFQTSQRFLTLMFEVEDVDKEYARLKNLDMEIEFTFPPTTQPWGVRAFGFQDPDGNNVNFLSPVDKDKR